MDASLKLSDFTANGEGWAFQELKFDLKGRLQQWQKIVMVEYKFTGCWFGLHAGVLAKKGNHTYKIKHSI